MLLEMVSVQHTLSYLGTCKGLSKTLGDSPLWSIGCPTHKWQFLGERVCEDIQMSLSHVGVVKEGPREL